MLDDVVHNVYEFISLLMFYLSDVSIPMEFHTLQPP